MKPSFATTQQVFWEAITHPTGVDAYLKQADETTVALFNSTFAETAEFTRTARVEVYAEAYFFRLLDVLAEQFPMLLWLVGAERFHNLVTDYLLAHPSQSPNLRRLGDALPGFLETHPLSQDYPQVVEFSRIELAIDQALDAPDGSLLTREQLALVPPSSWPAMHLTFCPSLQLVSCGWDYRVFRDAQCAEAPAPRSSVADPKLSICIWRKQFVVYTRTLSAAEAVLLRELKSGASFGEASATAALVGADAHELVAHLGRWLQDELLSAVDIG